MTKVELESKIVSLEAALYSSEANSKTLLHDLKDTNRQLEYINKVKITKNVVNDIRDVIDEAIRKSSLNDAESYHAEFEIDYSNSLAISSIEFNDADQLSEEIANGIENLFNIISDENEN
tara:strand:- start:1479 stop:1838 length:360 start_codon:yes stop_codon:yes gene_type:complete